ncbi:hypothetical protein GWI33_011609, partial [Rhynchophorus ferrugineus]
NFKG